MSQDFQNIIAIIIMLPLSNQRLIIFTDKYGTKIQHNKE